MRYNDAEGDEHILSVPATAAGTRLDVFLASTFGESSRSFLKRIVDDGLVDVEPGRNKPSHKLKGGETITLLMPALVELSAEPEAIPIDVLYEDDSLIVINKQPDLVVHPSPGHESGTLVNALLHHCQDLSGIGGVLRPGIVHRLDKGTSGCLVAAKTDAAHQDLTAQFAARNVQKTYWAITNDIPKPPEGKVEGQIGRHPKHRQKQAMLQDGGRYSLTLYQTLETFSDKHALVECDLKTGRTHQIRVHMKHIRAPLLCDADYGKSTPYVHDGKTLLARQALHAKTLSFSHPENGERLEFHAPLPDDLNATLQALRSTAR